MEHIQSSNGWLVLPLVNVESVTADNTEKVAIPALTTSTYTQRTINRG